MINPDRWMEIQNINPIEIKENAEYLGEFHHP